VSKWIGKIHDTVIDLLEKGGIPEVALVKQSVYDLVRKEILECVEYGYTDPRFGKDYGTFIRIGGCEIEIVPRHDLDCSVLIGERAGLLPESLTNENP